MAHEFLSDEWFAAIGALPVPEPLPGTDHITVNIVVTRDGSTNTEVHLADGRMEVGLKEGAPTTLTVPYEVARDLFVRQDQQAAMQAFMSGRIKIEGDMTTIMAMAQRAPSPEQEAYAAKILELTTI